MADLAMGAVTKLLGAIGNEALVLGRVKGDVQFIKEEMESINSFLLRLALSSTIVFEGDAAPELKKMALSSTSIKYLNGVGGLPKLKELELKGNKSLDGVGHLPRLSELELKGDNKIILLSLLEQKNANLVAKGDNKIIFLTLLKQKNADLVAKVTIHGTKLKKDDLQVLAKKQNLHCLVLLDESYEDEDSQLSFNEDEFPRLELLIVKCTAIKNISFTDGAAPKLQEITWTFNRMDSLSGIKNLPKLKRLVFIGDYIPYQVIDDIKAHPIHIVLTHRAMPQQQDDEDHDDESPTHRVMPQQQDDEDHDDERFSFSSCFSKNCIDRC
ncbi:hypothetical protein ABZP36_009616 [Zizania latifolia]